MRPAATYHAHTELSQQRSDDECVTGLIHKQCLFLLRVLLLVSVLCVSTSSLAVAVLCSAPIARRLTSLDRAAEVRPEDGTHSVVHLSGPVC